MPQSHLKGFLKLFGTHRQGLPLPLLPGVTERCVFLLLSWVSAALQTLNIFHFSSVQCCTLAYAYLSIQTGRAAWGVNSHFLAVQTSQEETAPLPDLAAFHVLLLFRSASSWPTCLTMGMTAWDCTPLRAWSSLCSAGPIFACKHCPLSNLQESTLKSFPRRRIPCGRWEGSFNHS